MFLLAYHCYNSRASNTSIFPKIAIFARNTVDQPLVVCVVWDLCEYRPTFLSCSKWINTNLCGKTEVCRFGGFFLLLLCTHLDKSSPRGPDLQGAPSHSNIFTCHVMEECVVFQEIPFKMSKMYLHLMAKCIELQKTSFKTATFSLHPMANLP